MNTWTNDELTRIGNAEEVEIASLRDDGTPRNPVTVWVVRVGDDLYVRSWRGRAGSWFRHIQQRPEAHIAAGGVARDVTLLDTSADEALNNKVDAAYQSKYGKYGAAYIPPMIAPQARATTRKLVPSA
ncbi:MAG: hypothetical protein UZ15_CFX003000645 [Chloroflexi bacterium OLB15]|nr:MAG: hypothetical protein UZ15_CFX003000645 [Chloroflexi bacterium OLB15]